MPTKFETIDSLGGDIGKTIAYQLRTVFKMFLEPKAVCAKEGVLQFVTGEMHPMGNMALLSEGVSDEDIEKVVGEFDTLGVPCAVLLLDEAAKDRARLLAERGFFVTPAMPAMAVDLSLLRSVQLPDGYEFEVLDSAESSDSWCEALAEGYELPVSLANLFAPEAVSKLDLGEDDYITCRIVRGGETVATSQMLLKDGLAGIYCVSTLAAERGKGLGAFVTYEPLRLAKERGFRVGVLQSSEMGRPVYERLGFETYGDIEMYARMPE